MRQISVSPIRLTKHEFNRALRRLSVELDKMSILQGISAAKNDTARKFSKGFIFALLLFIVITSSQSEIDIHFKNVIADVNIRKIYAVVALSIVSSMSLIEFTNYMVLNEYQSLVSRKIFKFDNSQALSILYDYNSAWSLGINPQFGILKSQKYHNIRSYTALIVMLIPILFGYFLYYYYVISFSISYLFGYSYVKFGDSLAVLSILISSAPFVIWFFLFYPSNLEKNASFIRWGFLFPLHRRLNFYPASLDQWLK